NASRGRGGPERAVVGAVTCEPRDETAGPVGPVNSAGQVAGGVRPRGPAHRLVVAAVHVVPRGHELGTVRLVAGDVRGRLLRDANRRSRPERPGAPDVLEALEDRVSPGRRVRVGDLRPVEGRGLAARLDVSGRDDPL